MNFLDWICKKTTFFGWKIFLTVSSFIVAVLTMFVLASPEAPNWLEFWFVISSGVFSAMVLVWFIDEIGKRLQEKEDKLTEAKKIKQFDQILQLYLTRYDLFLYCLTTPVARRKNGAEIKINPDFSFKDMQDMFLPTGLLGEGIVDSSIECFVRAESVLREEIETMAQNIDYVYYTDIQNCLLDFIKASLIFNQKETWILAKCIGSKKESKIAKVYSTLSNDMVYLLKSGQMDRWYKDEIMVENDSYRSCFALHEMIRFELAALKKYKQQMNKINIEVTDTKQITQNASSRDL